LIGVIDQRGAAYAGLAQPPYHGDQGGKTSVVRSLRFACVSLATLIMTG